MKLETLLALTHGQVAPHYKMFGHCQYCGRCVPLSVWQPANIKLSDFEKALHCTHCGWHNARLLLQHRTRHWWLPYKPAQIDEPDIVEMQKKSRPPWS